MATTLSSLRTRSLATRMLTLMLFAAAASQLALVVSAEEEGPAGTPAAVQLRRRRLGEAEGMIESEIKQDLQLTAGLENEILAVEEDVPINIPIGANAKQNWRVPSQQTNQAPDVCKTFGVPFPSTHVADARDDAWEEARVALAQQAGARAPENICGSIINNKNGVKVDRGAKISYVGCFPTKESGKEEPDGTLFWEPHIMQSKTWLMPTPVTGLYHATPAVCAFRCRITFPRNWNGHFGLHGGSHNCYCSATFGDWEARGGGVNLLEEQCSADRTTMSVYEADDRACLHGGATAEQIAKETRLHADALGLSEVTLRRRGGLSATDPAPLHHNTRLLNPLLFDMHKCCKEVTLHQVTVNSKKEKYSDGFDWDLGFAKVVWNGANMWQKYLDTSWYSPTQIRVKNNCAKEGGESCGGSKIVLPDDAGTKSSGGLPSRWTTDGNNACMKFLRRIPGVVGPCTKGDNPNDVKCVSDWLRKVPGWYKPDQSLDGGGGNFVVNDNKMNTYYPYWDGWTEHAGGEVSYGPIGNAFGLASSMHCKAFKPFYDISSPDPPVLYGYQAAHLEGVWIRAQNTRRDVMYGAGELKWSETKPLDKQIVLYFAGSTNSKEREHYPTFHDPSHGIWTGKAKLDYVDGLARTRYGGTPSGAGLDSYRLTETMMFGTVPVLSGPGYVPPFSTLLDWSKFSIAVSIDEMANLPAILAAISKKNWLRMARHSAFVFESYMTHRHNIANTEVQIMTRNIERARAASTGVCA